MTLVEAQPTRLGQYAGPVTRAIAWLLDVAISVVVFDATIAVCLFLADLLTPADVRAGDVPEWLAAILLGGWLFAYFGGSWAASGKTVGMALLGLRVVNGDGSMLERWRGFLRAPALALSLLTFGIGLVGIVVGRRHRGLQDVIAGSVVVYDWDARSARLRFLARRVDLGA
ncbi:MAG TPA: RDD family protein [Acidimicrobiia bacterium]|jgi:uncharacterized RDD family membrane protein YckC